MNKITSLISILNIKKDLAIAFLLLFLCISSYAQLKFGFKAGANFTNGKFDDANPDPSIGFNVGVLSEVIFSEKVFLRPEALYSLKGWKFSGGSMGLHYLNFPLLVGYRPISKLSIHAGPEIGFLLKSVRKPIVSGFISAYEKFDYGILFGAAYNITHNIGLELRYTHGFDTLLKAEGRDVNNNPTGETLRDGANRIFQVNVFYVLTKKEN